MLLSKEYAAERRKLIDPEHASMESRPGEFGGKVAMPTGGGSSAGIQDTTCVNVVDRQGNVWSATPSGAWLPSVIMGDTGHPAGHAAADAAGEARDIPINWRRASVRA